MITQQLLTQHQSQYYAWLLTRRAAGDTVESLASKRVAHELTDSLRKNVTVDWAQGESVRATLRLMVKRVLRKYKYPPDL